MKTIHVILLTAFAAGIAAVTPAAGRQDSAASSDASSDAPPAPAPAGGPLMTMPHGTYECALPGDAAGAAYVPAPQESFRIFTASRYEAGLGAGTYIMRGTQLTFTRGPRKGERFERVGDNQLRRLAPDGAATDLLCTRTGSR